MSFIQAGVTALLAVSSIYNKVSLNRSTIETYLKQGYVLTCDQRYLKNSVFPPRSNDSVFANSVLATTLQNITPVNKKNKLLFIKGRTWQKLRMKRPFMSTKECGLQNASNLLLIRDCGLGMALYHLGPWYIPPIWHRCIIHRKEYCPPLSPGSEQHWQENLGSCQLSSHHSDSQKKQVKLNLVMYIYLVGL